MLISEEVTVLAVKHKYIECALITCHAERNILEEKRKKILQQENVEWCNLISFIKKCPYLPSCEAYEVNYFFDLFNEE